MTTPIHKLSFAYGIVSTLLLVSLFGAARSVQLGVPQYDAFPVGGRGLQIVAHGTNTLYNYKREQDGDVAKYKLVEIVDLSVAGRAELRVEKVE